MYKISSQATAQLLVLNAALYAEEKSKEVSRYRFSRQTLRDISGWGRLSGPFIEELTGDLQRMGWIYIDFSDTEIAIIQAPKITVWPKLTAKRLRADSQLWTTDEEKIHKAYVARFPMLEVAEVET